MPDAGFTTSAAGMGLLPRAFLVSAAVLLSADALDLAGIADKYAVLAFYGEMLTEVAAFPGLLFA